MRVHHACPRAARAGRSYDYAGEPFSVRCKDFWPLYHAHKVIHNMIPSLSHEADGLILQVRALGLAPKACARQGLGSRAPANSRCQRPRFWR